MRATRELRPLNPKSGTIRQVGLWPGGDIHAQAPRGREAPFTVAQKRLRF
jgi:hypothetical protein